MKYIRNVLAALRRADNDFSLISEGDKILVGLSGGKDSLSLLRALSVYGHFAHKHFTLQPVYLDLGFGGGSLEPLKQYCASLGYTLYVSDSRFVYEVLKAHSKKNHHIPCSICSRMKKAAMNSIAKELGFNKVAFAHHNDDAVETLFMNMIHGGRVATFEPKMYLERAKITFIRPLIYCKESDLRLLAEEEKMPVYDSGCPANGHTERAWSKELLHSIYATHPEAWENFRSMLSNYENFSLYFSDIEWENDIDPTYALKPLLNPNDMRFLSLANKKMKPGEEDLLILHKHQKVGLISYRYESDHRIAIFNLEGPKEAQSRAIEELMARLLKKTNPVTFILYGVKKDLALALGYQKGPVIGRSSARYQKRIEQ